MAVCGQFSLCLFDLHGRQGKRNNCLVLSGGAGEDGGLLPFSFCEFDEWGSCLPPPALQSKKGFIPPGHL